MGSRSGLIAIFVSLILFIAAFFYYPKWKKDYTEATISWDISGYYFYLPAIFIFKDLKKLSFQDKIHQEYIPAGGQYQAFEHASGNWVMKYASGMALQYLPFFLVADLVAPVLGYARDGFSRPYQFMIAFGSILIAILGIFVTRRNLLREFKDDAVGLSLVILVLCTNFLEYGSISGPMPHVFLFTIYAIILALSYSFYNNPTKTKSLLIGTLCGLAVLTRPTDLLIMIIPLLWGVSSLESLKARLFFFKNKFVYLIIAAASCLVVSSLQLIYWKFVSGDWLVYSYQEQGFSWLHPHVRDGLFSYRVGWLLYTPVMAFALLGFYFLWKQKKRLFIPSILFFLMFIYVTLAWDIWWYGGSLGHRAMIQSYAILLFPLTAFTEWIFKRKWLKYIYLILIAVFAYYNIWMTHQAHRGGYFVAGGMVKAYFWSILGKWDIDPETRFLLDTNEMFRGNSENSTVIYQEGFEHPGIYSCGHILNGQRSLCLNPDNQESGTFSFQAEPGSFSWIYASANFHCINKEWDTWRGSEFIVIFRDRNEQVKRKSIRVHRNLLDGETKRLGFFVKAPAKHFSGIEMSFSSKQNDKSLVIDDLEVRAIE
jgi:hypothetical protein